MLATVSFAKSAVHARIQSQSFWIRIRARHVGRGLEEWVITQLRRGLSKKSSRVLFLHRRVGILARARRLERITTLFDFAVEIARFAANSKQIFEAIVMRFQFLVGHTPVLNSQVGIHDFFSITLLDMRFVNEIGNLISPGLAVPVNPTPTEACARQKGLPLSHR